MKKSILTEIHTIKKMMGLISEQQEEQMNYEDCLSNSMRFYFEKTTGNKNNEEGGMLPYWSRKGNDYPDLDDVKSFEKFLEIVKSDYTNNFWMVWDEMCGEKPEWEEVLPTITQLYYKTLTEKTKPGKEQYTEEDIPKLIARYSEEMPLEDFGDEFERADNIIFAVVDKIRETGSKMSDREYDRLFDKIKDEYGEQLIGF